MFNWSSHGRRIVSNFYKTLEKVELGGCSGEGWVEQLLRTPFCLAPLLLSWALYLCTSIRRFINKESIPKSWSFSCSQKVTSKYVKTSLGCTCG